MKKLFILMTAASLIFAVGCKKEDKTDDSNGNNGGSSHKVEQNSVAFYFGGTWCPPCGAYGKPTKEQLHDKYGDRLAIISCQVNSQSSKDPMNNIAANSLAGLFKATSVPSVYIAGNSPFSRSGFSNNISTNVTNISKIIDGLNGKTPNCSVTATTTWDGNNYTIKTESKFYEALAGTSGDYQVSVYILEDNLNYLQSSDASTEHKDMHSNVLRSNRAGTTTGDLLTGGDIAKDEVIKKTYTGSLESGWKKENLKVCVVVWRKYVDAGQNKVSLLNGRTFDM